MFSLRNTIFKICVIAGLLLFLNTQGSTTAGEATSAQIAFEQIKKMDGKWIGKSTRGWEEEISYRIIAGGSVVVDTSFDAHPGETMITTYYLDGNRLMLTHYCVARNQPRMVATSIESGGKIITFTYLDGTNLSSRDDGHMDKAVFRFVDENHVTSQWTWFENGKEKWLEEVHLERIK